MFFFPEPPGRNTISPSHVTPPHPRGFCAPRVPHRGLVSANALCDPKVRTRGCSADAAAAQGGLGVVGYVSAYLPVTYKPCRPDKLSFSWPPGV